MVEAVVDAAELATAAARSLLTGGRVGLLTFGTWELPTASNVDKFAGLFERAEPPTLWVVFMRESNNGSSIVEGRTEEEIIEEDDGGGGGGACDEEFGVE
jgi:hypothetical protein